MNDMLALPRSELLINFMWYRINMDMTNDAVQHHVSELFADEGWKQQPFMSQHGIAREKGALDYFCRRLTAQYVLPFRIRYDAQEDRMAGSRAMSYLIHASNNLKAVLLMKEVMWPLGDEEGTFDYSGKSQAFSFPRHHSQRSCAPFCSGTLPVSSLPLMAFADGHGLFHSSRSTTGLCFRRCGHREPFRSRQVTSKGKGLSGRDLVRFLKEQR